MAASALGLDGAMCTTTQTDAARSAGRPATTRVSVCTPPAEAPMTTRSRTAPRSSDIATGLHATSVRLHGAEYPRRTDDRRGKLRVYRPKLVSNRQGSRLSPLRTDDPTIWMDEFLRPLSGLGGQVRHRSQSRRWRHCS